jgi:hypothetical protein
MESIFFNQDIFISGLVCGVCNILEIIMSLKMNALNLSYFLINSYFGFNLTIQFGGLLIFIAISLVDYDQFPNVCDYNLGYYWISLLTIL